MAWPRARNQLLLYIGGGMMRLECQPVVASVLPHALTQTPTRLSGRQQCFAAQEQNLPLRRQLGGRGDNELLRRGAVRRHNAEVRSLPEQTPYYLVQKELGGLQCRGQCCVWQRERSSWIMRV